MSRRRTGSRDFHLGFMMFFFLLGISPTAYAYMDPGVGTFIVQMFVAFLVGIVMMMKVFWTRITHWIQGIKDRFKKNR